ncbi:Type I secretion membrane fusion protein, HlyD family [Roseibacterium elongatum DSM 19469]|uniref:Membrane fusion protein (MFP) family protein n=1 Tax=Roseicyclus elongatus DSM 19469 TaxID=1294273 RepID=W8RRI8_9RHOB|nr:HlyD family type I secretion periplasmic adaptor subunit [Roseibacterium elongatum]AHM03794.1 Type I secretion membrane fusion protein, HlyD family [Roseibacterium elongatum DSM 19469]
MSPRDSGGPAPTGPERGGSPDKMPHPVEKERARPAWSVRGPMLIGLFAMLLLIAGFFGWAMTSRLAGAVIAAGQIEVDRNRQPLQHPEGGLVAELFVDEGDRIAQGALILRFDGADVQSDLAVQRDRLAELRARRARLEAERDGDEAVQFAPDLLAQAAEDPEVADFLDGQRNLFQARADTLQSEVRQLSRRLSQIALQIDGFDAQETALQEQLAIVEEDLARQSDALERGVGLSGPVLNLQREAARMRGQLAGIEASRAEAAERTVEVELAILQRSISRREEAIAELREIRASEQEAAERVAALERNLTERELRAPVSGIVFGLTVFGDRGVVRPADPIGYIVPDGRPLVLGVQVPAIDVDQVFVGQDVMLRFPAFPQREVPDLTGQVTLVSADAFVDEATGGSFYRAEIVMDESQIALLGDKRLIPGMPVQAFIRTADRTPLEYLLEPIADYFNRAFRES